MAVLLAKLKELSEVVIILKSNDNIIRKACVYPNSVTETYQTLEASLDADSRFVHDPFFESMVLKKKMVFDQQILTVRTKHKRINCSI